MIFLPIVERELREASRKRGARRLRFFAALGGSLIWLLMMASAGRASASSLGQSLFGVVSTIAELACLASGIFLTADCLSEERREGTLGLLFLTDLKGYDVVLGKLVANSIHAVYALLAILPVMGLPLLMGGVTGAEFGRVALALLVTLMFSLSAGMLVSAVSRETRLAMGGVMLILIVVTCVLPILHEALSFVWGGRRTAFLLWLSPLHAFFQALFISYWVGTRPFWMSMVTQGLLSAVFLGGASGLLPRAWQERRRGASAEKRAETVRALRFGKAEKRGRLRARLMGRNPFHWLVARDRLPAMGGRLLFGAMLVLWCCLFGGVFIAPSPTNIEAFSGTICITLGLNFIFKGLVAMEASRRLSEDRQSGALELLLVTPLPERQIIRGQRRGLWGHFAMPMAMLLLAEGVLSWMLLGPNPMKIPRFERAMVVTGLIGGMAMTVLDFLALGWAGMWMGLRMKKHHRAVLAAFAQVLLAPWLAGLLVVFPIVAGGGAISTRGITVFLVFWFLIGAVNDLVVIVRARRKLRREFRRQAAGLAAEPKPAVPAIATAELEPATP